MRDSNAAPYPPPDVISPSFLTPSQTFGLQGAEQAPQLPLRSALSLSETASAREDFLIVGLFALRLTLQMINSLSDYNGRVDDVNWLNAFLGPYDPAYDLAKISGSTRAEFLNEYPVVLSRMKRQDKYPQRFMAMNPTISPRTARAIQSGMTDADRKEIIDFVDTATEWGSMVLIPRDEGKSILKMADQRLVADLGVGRGGFDRPRRREDPVTARDSPPRRVLQDRHIFLDDYDLRRQ